MLTKTEVKIKLKNSFSNNFEIIVPEINSLVIFQGHLSYRHSHFSNSVVD